MQFVSKFKAQILSFRPVRKKIIKTDLGDIAEVVPGISVRFTPLNPPMYCDVFPKNEAWGILDSSDAARQSGLQEEQISHLILNHKEYGIQFVAIERDGRLLVSGDKHVVESGEKGYYCVVCKQHFQDARGKRNHLEKSEKHIKNVALAEGRDPSEIDIVRRETEKSSEAVGERI